MAVQEKTLPLYFESEETQGNACGFHLSAIHAAIVASVALHAFFLLFLALQPAADTVAVQTFHISFEEDGSYFLQKESSASRAEGQRETAPPPQKERAKVQNNAITAAPAVATKIATEEIPQTSEKSGTAKSAETILPTPSEIAKGDGLLAAVSDGIEYGRGTTQSVSQNSGASAGAATTGAAGSNPWGISKTGSETGFGSGSGGHASLGTGSGIPLETKFGETNAPTFIRRATPVYPSFARRQGKEGRVVLTLLIDQMGKVQRIDVTEPAGYGLTEAAIEAVKKSTFAPASVNGQKVFSRAVLPIRFKLE
ncbi:MAG: energy transducer TonB [Syntrophales bacterium]|nr:energy transducer TonB [Syntrophales bacterium]